jgi:hypothetical protein
MTSKRREDGRACRCDQHEVSCVGLTVGRLSSERVAELAEEIWTATTGRVLPARPIQDPRSSRPGASAQAAYQRRRQQELRAWLHGGWWRLGAVAGAAAGVDLLVGLTVGAWLGSLMALVAALVAGWRLRVHDVTLPGWPAATAAHGDIAMAGTRRHGRSVAEAALAGGSLRRHAGRRGVAARAAAAVRPRWPAGGQPVGRGRHGGDHAAPRRCHPSGSAATGQ